VYNPGKLKARLMNKGSDICCHDVIVKFYKLTEQSEQNKF